MGGKSLQPTQQSSIWPLVRRQHGVVARSQLLALGLTRHAIQHRIDHGRLHPIWRGVYAVGRPEVTERGRCMAAVLACGPEAMLSHRSAARLWGLVRSRSAQVEIAVPGPVNRSYPGIRVHRQTGLNPSAHRHVDGIPVTDPAWTLIDLASCIGHDDLEAAVNEADRLDLIHPEDLRIAIESSPRRPGIGRLRALLERQTFALTDSVLERRFLPIARRAGLPAPLTQVEVNGFRVDFHWPDLGLIVETDGLRYHRTASRQAKDRLRDQTHSAAGLTALRFTAAQVRFEPDHVRATLAAVAARLHRLKESAAQRRLNPSTNSLGQTA